MPVGARFSVPVQPGSGAHTASYTMGTGSFPGVKRPGRGVDHPSPPSAEVKERVQLYLYSPSGSSWPVIRWPLPLPHIFQKCKELTRNSRRQIGDTRQRSTLRTHNSAVTCETCFYLELSARCAWPDKRNGKQSTIIILNTLGTTVKILAARTLICAPLTSLKSTDQ